MKNCISQKGGYDNDSKYQEDNRSLIEIFPCASGEAGLRLCDAPCYDEDEALQKSQQTCTKNY